MSLKRSGCTINKVWLRVLNVLTTIVIARDCWTGWAYNLSLVKPRLLNLRLLRVWKKAWLREANGNLSPSSPPCACNYSTVMINVGALSDAHLQWLFNRLLCNYCEWWLMNGGSRSSFAINAHVQRGAWGQIAIWCARAWHSYQAPLVQYARPRSVFINPSQHI